MTSLLSIRSFRYLALLPFAVFAFVAQAQTKAKVQIKKNQNGVTTDEVREFELSEGQNIDDVLKEMGILDEFGQLKDGEQFSISIEKNMTGDAPSQLRMFMQPGTSAMPPMPPMPSMQGMEMPKQNVAWLGVMMRTESTQVKGKEWEGAYVTEVVEGSPAAEANIETGDLVVEFNSKKIASSNDLVQCVRDAKPGEKVKLVVIREGKKKNLKVELGSKEQDMIQLFNMRPTPAPFPSDFPDMFNFQLAPDSILIFSPDDSMSIQQPFSWNQEGMCSEQTAYLGVTPMISSEENTDNAAVRIDVIEGSAAEKMGLKNGDQIFKINETAILSFEDLASFVAYQKPNATVTVHFFRDGKEKEINGNLGSRCASTSRDFRIFHDYKGQDENGVFNYDYEFDMDNMDIEQKMEEMLKELEMQREQIQSQQNSIQEGLERLRENQQNEQMSIEIDEISPAEAESINKAAEPKLLTSNTLNFDRIVFLPNPSNGAIKLSFATKEIGKLKVVVFDANGSKVYMEEQDSFDGNYENDINISSQPNGAYYLDIIVGGNTYSKKIIKG
jgi:C-terminal processing protease CtpA/Prc